MYPCPCGLELFVIVVALLTLCMVAQGAPPDVPDAEKEMLDTVDPWGLPFSDQLTRFQSHFAAEPQASFAVGIAHDLVKVWPPKYWFRGETFLPAEDLVHQAKSRIAAAGETQSFQVAILPNIDAPDKTYTISVDAQGADVTVFRQVFVTTSKLAAYPRYAADRWPDPLLPETEVAVSGPDCGAFWVDVELPRDAPAGVIDCVVTVTDGDSSARIAVPVKVVPGLALDPKAYPFVGWFRRHKMTPEAYRDHCALVLKNHVVPVDALKGQWDPENPQKFDDMRAFLESHGQRLFEVDRPGTKNFDSLYEHLKTNGWVESTVAYSNKDEPDDETFIKENAPFMEMVREKYPGLKIYLASDWHENMAAGCDAWMTDISASGYDPEAHRNLERPELWHYYCHLPVRWQMRAPLVDAPNMQIDNPALEQRLALWMSHYYGAKVVFIWSGNAWGLDDDFWEKPALRDKLSGFPYAGAHNGNGWVVYPSPDGEGTVPSLRLKLIRDGLEDVALLEAARKLLDEGKVTGERADRLAALLDPVPGVFVHPQYFDRLPETLLQRREAILTLLAEE